MYSDIKCPYCKTEIDIKHDEGYGYEENITYQQLCNICDKTFIYSTSIIYDYTVYKTPCLNKDINGKEIEHNWIITKTYHNCFCKMQCEWCEEKRELTEEEKIKYNIEPIKEYFNKLYEK